MSEKKAQYTARRFHDPLDDLLDKPIAYNPAFKRLTGSTVASIMLSQAWYWTKRTSDENGWFYKTIEDWEEETGLTRSEQETARKHLKRFMEVELKGVPATLYYRIDKEEIYAGLGIQFAETLQTGLPEPREQDSDNHSNYYNEPENTPENTTDMGEVVKKANKTVDAMLDQVRNGEGKVSYPKREALPEPIRELIDEFVSISGIKPMAKEVSHWLMAGQDWLNIGATREDVRGALQYAKGKFTMTDPGSLTKTLRSYKTGNIAESFSDSPETDSPAYQPYVAPPENPNAMTYEEWMKSKENNK